MYKKGLALGFLLLFILPCFAQGAQEDEGETFTITTYYPSPYGSYNRLQTNYFAVGDTDLDGDMTDADQPNREGDIRIKPQLGDPEGWPIGEEGQLAYSKTNHALYQSDGLEWKTASGAAYTTCIGVCANNNSPTCPGGEGYTMVTSNVGDGCQVTSYGIRVGWGGFWGVTTREVTFSQVQYDTYEDLIYNYISQCTVKCSTRQVVGGYFSNPYSQTTALSSSQAICCK